MTATYDIVFQHRGMELINDSFQNRKQYNIPKAQLLIADIPYNIGNFAYGSNPSWYVNGDNNQGESDKAGKSFFYSDSDFNLYEFFHFASRMLKPEPKERGKAPCMVVFCSYEEQFELIEASKQQGFNHYINLVLRKRSSAQALKANMRIVGNCEYALVFYRDKLPKFNNGGHMVMNCMEFPRDKSTPKVHPTQKPVQLLEYFVRLFTDAGDVVIDPVAGSGTTLLAAEMCGRKSYGFEIQREYYNAFQRDIAPRANQEVLFK